MVVEKIAVSYTSHATQEKITGLSQVAASNRGGSVAAGRVGPRGAPGSQHYVGPRGVVLR